jgi:hypothetical protein
MVMRKLQIIFFIACPIASSIRNWITGFNNFIFSDATIQDLQDLDCDIPLKNACVVELVRSIVLWVIWLERKKKYISLITKIEVLLC